MGGVPKASNAGNVTKVPPPATALMAPAAAAARISPMISAGDIPEQVCVNGVGGEHALFLEWTERSFGHRDTDLFVCAARLRVRNVVRVIQVKFSITLFVVEYVGRGSRGRRIRGWY